MRLSALLAALLLATPAAAQFPGSLAGVVTDRATGAPLPAVLVEVSPAGRAVRTDAAGTFLLRGVEAGAQRLLLSRAGYAPARLQAEVRDGATTRLSVRLAPAPVLLEEVRVEAARGAGEVRVGRAAIEASGARTLAEVLERAGGVLVTGTGPTGARAVSIRGGAADAVLVLVDGVAVNDPLTGEADLSQLPAAAIERVTVLAGARSARYGPRAQSGVVLVETRAPVRSAAAALSLGSLGERAASAEWGAAGVAGGVHGRLLEGRFRFRGPYDGVEVERDNADLREAGAWGSAAGRLGGGEARARLGWSGVERGIPGRAAVLSPHARQSGARTHAALGWRRVAGRTSLSLGASGELRGAHFANPAPPDSFPYDSRARARTLTLRGEVQRAGSGGVLREWGAGAEATGQRVQAGSLSAAAPRTRTDAGVWGSARAARDAGAGELGVTLDLRVDRDGLSGALHPTHALALSLAAEGRRLQLAQRSAYSPPTLGDQFFQEGVGIAPNPGLRPERVPSEWELSGAWAQEVAGARLEAGGTAYRGDVRGMILWAPDFRGIWSPRNADVRRRGGELWGRVASGALTLGADWSLNRVTYLRSDGTAPVQVVYRPRHAGAVRLGWTPGPWRAEGVARYTGWRNPTPEDSNRLPGFWTLGGRVARGARLGGYRLDLAVEVDRLGGERDALIFGHPEPGRRVRLDLRLFGAGTP